MPLLVEVSCLIVQSPAEQQCRSFSPRSTHSHCAGDGLLMSGGVGRRLAYPLPPHTPAGRHISTCSCPQVGTAAAQPPCCATTTSNCIRVGTASLPPRTPPHCVWSSKQAPVHVPGHPECASEDDAVVEPKQTGGAALPNLHPPFAGVHSSQSQPALSKHLSLAKLTRTTRWWGMRVP